MKKMNCLEDVAGCSKKGQMKIQQMAFVLVTLFIFFSIAAVIYFSFYLTSIRQSAESLRQDEVREIVRKITSTPELAFTSSSDCVSCIDLDKALILSTDEKYGELWNIKYLAIERILNPEGREIECTLSNYPNCNILTIISSENIAAETTFVTLVRRDPETKTFKYEIGKVHASGVN